jgi:CheY-like chemotaxis protein
MHKVLIVEDEELVARMIMTALQWLRHECTWVRDGNEALVALQTLDPDVVLTDLRMSGMDGVELIRKLREGTPYRRVVAMTGCRDTGPDSLPQAALRAGADQLLAKPFRVADLLSAIGDVLRRDVAVR